jgi:hypothetical protein
MTDNEKQLTYYNGFSDGTHVCNMAIIAMADAVTKSSDVKQIKMVVMHTVKTLADISDETNIKLELLLKQVMEEQHGLE